jgi:hypothetical protein
MVCAKAIKKESKWKWKHPNVLKARGMKLSLDACSTCNHVFSSTSIIVTCVFIINACYIISMQVKSIIMTSIEVRKPYLMAKISIHHWVWWRKRWKTFLWTCAPLSKAIIAMVSQSVLWITIHSLPQKYRNKWILKLSMIWPH